MGSGSSIAKREKLQLLRPLQYCRERGRERATAIPTTAAVLQRDREKLQLLRPLQYCRLGETANTSTAPVLQKRKPAITTTAPVLQRERETALTTTAPVLQRERNCDYCDPSSMANREKLQALRPLQCCRNRETATATTAPNQKLEGCKLGRIQSWKMCFIPTVGCWNLGCASSNFAAATITGPEFRELPIYSLMKGLGLKVWGFRFRALGFGFWVQGL